MNGSQATTENRILSDRLGALRPVRDVVTSAAEASATRA